MYCSIRVKCWVVQNRYVTTTGVSKIIVFFKREPKVSCRLGELICAQRNIIHHTLWTLESQYLTKSFKFLSYRLWFALASHFIASYYDTKKYNSEKHNSQKRRINECRKQKTIRWSYLKRKMYSSRSLTIFRRFKTPKVLRDEALSL